MNGTLNEYAAEFVSLVDYCIEENQGYMTSIGYAVEKNVIEALLARFAYDSPKNKLLIWRDLKWIICDNNHISRLVTKDNKKFRVILIDTKIQASLKNLIEVQQEK